MTCSGRYSEAWAFAAFWCVGNTITGSHEGADGAATLTYSQGDFLSRGVQPYVGMVIYNLTQDTNGPITDVTATTITAVGVTWDTGDTFRLVLIDGIEISTIEHYLDVAASDVHAALAASGQCDCTWASWASGFVSKLNIIDAAAYYQCSCGQPHFGSTETDRYLQWASNQLELLMTGRLDICEGATGLDFPAMGWAAQGHTDWQKADIIWKDILRNG